MAKKVIDFIKNHPLITTGVITGAIGLLLGFTITAMISSTNESPLGQYHPRKRRKCIMKKYLWFISILLLLFLYPIRDAAFAEVVID